MTKNLLVELGLEELPAYVVTPSEKQLGEKMAAFLGENRLSYESIQTFSTPRRLAVRVLGLADQQTDLTEDFKGPSKKIALDADGNLSGACTTSGMAFKMHGRLGDSPIIGAGLFVDNEIEVLPTFPLESRATNEPDFTSAAVSSNKANFPSCTTGPS